MAAKSPKLLSLTVPEDRGSREPSVLSGAYAPRGSDYQVDNKEYQVDELSEEETNPKHKSFGGGRESLIRLLKWGEEETDDEEDEDEEDNYPKHKTEWSSAGRSFRKWSEWDSSDDEE
jgi:hypothetical protein